MFFIKLHVNSQTPACKWKQKQRCGSLGPSNNISCNNVHVVNVIIKNNKCNKCNKIRFRDLQLIPSSASFIPAPHMQVRPWGVRTHNWEHPPLFWHGDWTEKEYKFIVSEPLLLYYFPILFNIWLLGIWWFPIDPIYKWLPIKNSFLRIKISPTNFIFELIIQNNFTPKQG